MDKVTQDILEVKEYHHVPGLSKNLLSLGQLMNNGYMPDFQTDKLLLRKTVGRHTTVIVCKRKTDGMYYLNGKQEKNKDYKTIHATENVDNWITVPAKKSKNTDTTSRKKVSMDLKAHDKFGHKNESLVRESLQVADIQPTGTIKSYEGCNLTKLIRKEYQRRQPSKLQVPEKGCLQICLGLLQKL